MSTDPTRTRIPFTHEDIPDATGLYCNVTADGKILGQPFCTLCDVIFQSQSQAVIHSKRNRHVQALNNRLANQVTTRSSVHGTTKTGENRSTKRLTEGDMMGPKAKERKVEVIEIADEPEMGNVEARAVRTMKSSLEHIDIDAYGKIASAMECAGKLAEQSGNKATQSRVKEDCAELAIKMANDVKNAVSK